MFQKCSEEQLKFQQEEVFRKIEDYKDDRPFWRDLVSNVVVSFFLERFVHFLGGRVVSINPNIVAQQNAKNTDEKREVRRQFV